MWGFVVLVPDQCLSFYFILNLFKRNMTDIAFTQTLKNLSYNNT